MIFDGGIGSKWIIIIKITCRVSTWRRNLAKTTTKRTKKKEINEKKKINEIWRVGDSNPILDSRNRLDQHSHTRTRTKIKSPMSKFLFSFLPVCVCVSTGQEKIPPDKYKKKKEMWFYYLTIASLVSLDRLYIGDWRSRSLKEKGNPQPILLHLLEDKKEIQTEIESKLNKRGIKKNWEIEKKKREESRRGS